MLADGSATSTTVDLRLAADIAYGNSWVPGLASCQDRQVQLIRRMQQFAFITNRRISALLRMTKLLDMIGPQLIGIPNNHDSITHNISCLATFDAALTR